MRHSDYKVAGIDTKKDINGHSYDIVKLAHKGPKQKPCKVCGKNPREQHSSKCKACGETHMVIKNQRRQIQAKLSSQ